VLKRHKSATVSKFGNTVTLSDTVEDRTVGKN